LIKKWSLTLICMLALSLLAGCAGSADMPTPTAMPARTAAPATTMPTVMEAEPSPTMEPTAAAATIGSSSDALRVAEAVEEELDKLSEVDDAEVLVFGNVALVGLEYDEQYQGGTTQRVTGMVKDRIGAIHEGLENVYVTDDPMQVQAIEKLKEALKKGDTAFEEIRKQAQTIVDALKGTAMPSAVPGADGVS